MNIYIYINIKDINFKLLYIIFQIFPNTLQFIAAMTTPGGGNSDISPRLKRHFAIFNVISPSRSVIDHIFRTIALNHFNTGRGFEKDISDLVEKLVPATRKIWEVMKQRMLPTPSLSHYMFNLRDLTRIWQGLISIPGKVSKLKLIRMMKIMMELLRN